MLIRFLLSNSQLLFYRHSLSNFNQLLTMKGNYCVLDNRVSQCVTCVKLSLIPEFVKYMRVNVKALWLPADYAHLAFN